MGRISKKPFNSLEKRVLEIKAKRGDAWVGSCVTAVNIIDHIFKIKKKDEKFILSAGHAGCALYVVLEKYGIITKKQAETLISHPHLNPELGIYASTGSLGHGIGIALGMAISNPKKNVYCMLTDGECAEGSVWEALKIMKEQAPNLKVYVNINGWNGLSKVDKKDLMKRLSYYIPKKNICFTECRLFKGLENHYRVITKEEYEKRVL